MSASRFVLVPGTLASGARRMSWPDRTTVVGVPGGSWVAWRLLGRNNHELGRSATVFPTAEHVLADVLALRDVVEELAVTVHADAEQAEWRWRLALDGRPVAVSARTYLRQRECHYSASMFRQAVPFAQSPVVLPVAARRAGRAARTVVDLTVVEQQAQGPDPVTECVR